MELEAKEQLAHPDELVGTVGKLFKDLSRERPVAQPGEQVTQDPSPQPDEYHLPSLFLPCRETVT